MPCNTLTNRYEPCKEFVGGIKGAFFVPFTFSDNVTKDGAGIVTQIYTTGGSVKATGYFLELKGLSTFETTATASRDNGNTSYETIFTLSFKPSGKTFATADADMTMFNTLAQGRWRIIVWDRNDQFWLLGETLGCDANGGTSSWGVQMGDARLFTMTLSSMEPYLPTPVMADDYADMGSVITISAT
jgi:hypothetical protein